MILEILFPLCGIVLCCAVILFLVWNVKRRNQMPTDQEVNEKLNRMHIERINKP